VDLVILAEQPRRYLEDTTWTRQLGDVVALEREDWGMVQALRATYGDGLEVEFGLTTPRWAATAPLDRGTQRVVAGGCRIIFDRQDILVALLRAASDTA
jgi:hypothetical protein